METLKDIKSELQHVFVEGDATSQQMAHILVLMDIPLMLLVLVVCHFV
jgi:hypothetical protein